MSEQLTLTFGAPVCTLVCLHGEPWLGEHPKCAASVHAAIARCEADITAGRYNERGYTPAEWNAKLKRESAKADAPEKGQS